MSFREQILERRVLMKEEGSSQEKWISLTELPTIQREKKLNFIFFLWGQADFFSADKRLYRICRWGDISHILAALSILTVDVAESKLNRTMSVYPCWGLGMIFGASVICLEHGHRHIFHMTSE